MKIRHLLSFSLLTALPLSGHANPLGVTEFYSRIYTQAYVASVDLEENAPANPDNALRLPSTIYNLDLRADFEAKLKSLDIIFRPRANARDSRFEFQSKPDEDESDSEAFVNEWLLRTHINYKVFLSYGRENLQWGPAYLLSTSNPFNSRNGQNNPVVEQPGLDYARVVWVPGPHWTVSAIANVDEGEADDSSFTEKYALKFDYEKNQRYFSLIPSVEDDDDSTTSLGFYGGTAINDAVSFYVEGAVSDNDNRNQLLTGTTYTTLNGYTFTQKHSAQNTRAHYEATLYTQIS